MRWFDRTFTPGRPIAEAPGLLDRLGATADRLEVVLRDKSLPLLTHRPGGRWSMQEHAGHLLDLEPLWNRRLDDFDAGASVLSPADLDNRQTHNARHNERDPLALLGEFRAARSKLIERLAAMSAGALSRTARHPRLQQPMSVVDLCYFVAEHDDHHLGAIAGISVAHAAWPVYALDLVNAVDTALPRLLGMNERRTLEPLAPGKWSTRETIGHLVDSASNNHQRFVRAMFQDNLLFQGYAQDRWVAAQRYQDAPWEDLATLWATFNRHLARVMAATPESVRLKPQARHNLHELAFRPIPPSQPATLDYFMADYVEHLRHHLRQIPELSL